MKTEFKKSLRTKLLVIAPVVVLLSSGSIAQAIETDFNNTWQTNILTNPSERQLQREKQGKVTIFDGLTDKLINNIMDSQFDRLESMMFTRIVVTDYNGKPKRDPDTGNIVTEGDDC